MAWHLGMWHGMAWMARMALETALLWESTLTSLPVCQSCQSCQPESATHRALISLANRHRFLCAAGGL